MPRLVVILGPTAVGKTAIALDLACAVGGEIVNADALQVYRGLDIGTAKPTPEERRRVRHHLIDILDPDEGFSAGEFARRARSAIEEIRRRDRLPLVVGGSGLYLRALLEGLAPLPPRSHEIRARLEERVREEGLDGLRRQLSQLDPETAARLEAGDRQRLVRALEVVLASGRPISYWQRRQPFGTRPLQAVRVGLTLPRSILYDRIALRVGRMIEMGWLQEVAALLGGGVSRHSPAFQAIGYRELARHVDGEMSLEEAVERIVRATRRFAKRQMTWFRKEKDVTWFRPGDGEYLLPEILEHLRIRGSGRGHDEA